MLFAVASSVVAGVEAAGARRAPRRRADASASAVAVRRLLAEYGFTVAEVAGRTAPAARAARHAQPDDPAGAGAVGPADRAAAVAAVRLGARRGRRRRLRRRQGEQQNATKALLPVAPRELAHALVGRVLGGALPVADVPSAGRARWRAPLSYRRLARRARRAAPGVDVRSAHDDHRCGPAGQGAERAASQGPLQRRLGLQLAARGHGRPAAAGRDVAAPRRRRGQGAARRAEPGCPRGAHRRSARRQLALEVGAQLVDRGGAGRRDGAEAEEAVDQPVVAAPHDRHAGSPERRREGLPPPRRRRPGGAAALLGPSRRRCEQTSGPDGRACRGWAGWGQ